MLGHSLEGRGWAILASPLRPAPPPTAASRDSQAGVEGAPWGGQHSRPAQPPAPFPLRAWAAPLAERLQLFYAGVSAAACRRPGSHQPSPGAQLPERPRRILGRGWEC